ncbi:hypothetical protein J2X06_001748 [Lysobacter niastensis]|uniref:AAA family ATPase n=1 Tax=Lysobacter niastensis TaxID=380629 RepID=A0ABU1WAB0_9GAMM|nr:helicase RepA family protein [Lysobacter niastensis]MDR7134564.1 hypothetical protein [Lysobacter niastensis]
MTDLEDFRSADEMAARFGPAVDVIEFSRGRRSRVGDANAKIAPNALKFERMGDLSVRPPDWLVRGFFEIDCLALLVGDPGTGKTFCALDLAASIATGKPFHGRNVKAGPVLYFAGEGQSGLARRRMAWEQAHGISLRNAPLFASTVATRLTDGACLALLLNEIECFTAEHGPPVLVVLDTLARNFGPGDENDTRDMNRAVFACDSIRRITGASVLITHHSSHADKGRGRGSTVLRAAADAEFLLTRKVDETVVLTATKMKDAAFPAPMAFCIGAVDLGLTDAEGETITSAVLVPTEYKAPTKASAAGTGKNQRRALRILRDMQASLTKTGLAQIGARVAMDKWRAQCAAEDMNRSRFREASIGLQSAGLVEIANGFAKPCERTKPVRNVQPSRGHTCDACEPPCKGVHTSHVAGQEADELSAATSATSGYQACKLGEP